MEECRIDKHEYLVYLFNNYNIKEKFVNYCQG